MMRELCRRLGAHWIGLLAICGCSDGRLPTYPVSGRVTFPDGSPVHVGAVEFKSREHGVQARGEIGDDGRFTMTTYQEGDGAVEGKHDCVVVQFVMVEDIPDFLPSQVGVVHPRHASYATSGLTLVISPAEANEITIEVQGLEWRDSRGEKHEHHAPE